MSSHEAAKVGAASVGSKRKEMSSSSESAPSDARDFHAQLFAAGRSSHVTRTLQQLREPASKKARHDEETTAAARRAEQASLRLSYQFRPMSSRTKNGAASVSTTSRPTLDLFYHLARGLQPEVLYREIMLAWVECPETTMKILCHARDCHGSGKGERLIVYHALMWLRKNKPRTYVANTTTFLSHGYFKDICNLVEMIDALPVLNPRWVKKHGATAKSPRLDTVGSAGPIGNSDFELQLLAEYIKGDYVKLSKWHAAMRTGHAQANVAPLRATKTASAPDTEWFNSRLAAEAEDAEWKAITGTSKLSVQSADLESVSASPSADTPTCSISLAAKYAPSERHHFASQAKRLAKILFTDEAAANPTGTSSFLSAGKGDFASRQQMQTCMKKYRALLSTLRTHLRITEKLACRSQWDSINFSTVPAKCHQVLRKAFMKHTPELYSEYLEGLTNGVGAIRVSGLQPHELVGHYLDGGRLDETIESAWKELVARTVASGTFDAAVSVVDVSISMKGTPMVVAIAMGLLVAESCRGAYHNRVLTFHESPEWHVIKGRTLRERVRCLRDAPWGGSTNLLSTFDLILDTAVEHRVASEHLPQTLFIFSDMQFDAAIGADWMKTNSQAVVRRYRQARYSVPNIVFWNLNGELNHDAPVQSHQAGCALMSGYSAGLLKVFLKSAISADPNESSLQPMRIMQDAIEPYTVVIDESER